MGAKLPRWSFACTVGLASLLHFGCKAPVATEAVKAISLPRASSGEFAPNAPISESEVLAWLRWHDAIAKSFDGGAGQEARASRARFETNALADAGLSWDRLDRIDSVVLAVMTARVTERWMQDAGEVPQMRELAQEFGSSSVAAVLAHEAAVARAWEQMSN